VNNLIDDLLPVLAALSMLAPFVTLMKPTTSQQQQIWRLSTCQNPCHATWIIMLYAK
jgi:hypothetical protein